MRILPALLVCARLLAAQAAKPAMPCADLRALTNYDISIAAAELIPASAEAPEHCRVSGQVLPQVGFEVNLPSAWNGRLYMFGNGGYAGEPFDGAGRAGTRARALTRGFATAATDTGHRAETEPLGTFAADRQKLFDYAFRSLHVTAETAKTITRAYYHSAPERSYFEGCSTGGRQGLILAQRFPADFDGIVVGAPVLDFSGTMVAYARVQQALRAAPLLPGKLPLLARTIYDRCDARDGVRDGLIADPRLCNFDPARDLPHCDGTADGSDCFTAAQVATLKTIYSDVASGGRRVFPGWPVGSEAAGPNGRSGWDPWLLREGGPSTETAFAEAFFGYLAFPKPDPAYSLASFDLDRDLPKLDGIHRILDATDTGLTPFRERGGKILMYYGWADPALNPLMGVEYYEAVARRMGSGTPDFFRLFMVPGMFHCGGGPGPDTFDKLGPLMDWVERGAAPESLVARHVEGGKTVRARPLCAYPAAARYKGTGSIDDPASFACAQP